MRTDEQRYALRALADHRRWLLVSDQRSPGWDRAENLTDERHLCSHHRATTERLSTFHANQLAAACPWCADPSKPEPLWHNGIGGNPTSKEAAVNPSAVV